MADEYELEARIHRDWTELGPPPWLVRLTTLAVIPLLPIFWLTETVDTVADDVRHRLRRN